LAMLDGSIDFPQSCCFDFAIRGLKIHASTSWSNRALDFFLHRFKMAVGTLNFRVRLLQISHGKRNSFFLSAYGI
jgi:hypothetical protein